MKERGMIFNGEMVRALLDDRKTQTRRPVRFPVLDKNLGCELAGNELAGELSAGNYLNSAFGKPGDRIWVREAYRFPASLDDVSPTGVGEMAVATGYRKPWAPTFYEFTGTFSDGWTGFETPPKVSGAGKLRPSIHMPRWASRITLEITDVRVERLNSIHDVDAMREGIQNLTTCSHADFGIPGVVNAQHPVRAFQLLWESIYGADNWKANPWVWVIEFKRVEGGAA
ncbi:TPA: morphogenetic protein [Klebsiella oxytoca]|uniref:morphogenetic protein n=1 Tax=Klebsiella oxytoca TaxID=571 RepID=UPI0011DDA5AF|nr:morphogenetic protein [Klebsiella oxytoca]EKV6447287.1 morphogenetic protein [Klebsiella oxytoca]TXU77261.1 morphogenetic protein [Klebsiella oxytoca]HCH7901627.1 morphogenetic protein [Klebsiella oxytoca]HEI9718393.1 morphogenetic protein [Klebsiella oxytoca]HEI9789964.1 morphogenetic protein [Klebsiella oxytoca]